MLERGPGGCLVRRAASKLCASLKRPSVLGCHSPCGVMLAENVEQEGLHVIVQGFVIQEQLGQQAKVLAVEFGLGTIHLQPCNSVMWCRRDQELCLKDVGPLWLTVQEEGGLQHTSNMTRVGTAAASEWLVRGSGER